MIGSVMTLGGIAGMLMTAPAGALIDATRHKRAFVIGPGLCTVVASALLLLSQNFWVVAFSQAATAIAGAAIGPAMAGITLGLVRQAGFNAQNGRNQAFNHAGNVVGAGLSGLLGWQFGFGAVFGLAAVFGALSIASVLMIPAASIDHAAARGLEGGEAAGETASGPAVLLRSRPLLILAAALACFHLGNGAMLPLYGLAVVAAKQGDPAGFVAMTIVVAQTVMVGASLLAMRMADRQGYWLVLLLSFVALPVRGVIAAHLITGWGVYPVQMLDGIGAGLQSVAVPGLVARILSGTGPGECGAGGGHDGAGARRRAEPRHRRMAGPGSGLWPGLHDPRQLRSRLRRALGGVPAGPASGLQRDDGRRRARARTSAGLARASRKTLDRTGSDTNRKLRRNSTSFAGRNKEGDPWCARVVVKAPLSRKIG